MIIVQTIGGLGNQLFQYAAGRCLAEKHGVELKLDIGAFDEYKLRNFDLQAFHTRFSFATPEETRPFTQRNFIQKLRNKLAPISWKKVYRHPEFHFAAPFHALPDGVYLKGYWQSEKYFAPISQLIRQEFRLQEQHINKVAGLGQTMKQEESVAVHIRRGDYTDPATQVMHGIIPVAHYQQAIQMIREKLQQPKFYIFSDAIQQVKEELPIADAVYVSGQYSTTHFEDLHLMSCCRHNIIANSSFSWWGAWLNDHPGKTVIAPRLWFREGPKDLQDLMPEDWIRI